MKYMISFCCLLMSLVCFADEQINQADNAPMNCDSKKIETCMQNCAKQLGSNVTQTRAAQALPKCVDTCSTQGCQVASNSAATS